MEMTEQRRSDRKRNQTDFLGATEAVAKDAGKTKESQLSACRAREAAIASAYEPLVGLVQLGEAGGGEGSALETALAQYDSSRSLRRRLAGVNSITSRCAARQGTEEKPVSDQYVDPFVIVDAEGKPVRALAIKWRDYPPASVCVSGHSWAG
jgi:hypothetical protein